MKNDGIKKVLTVFGKGSVKTNGVYDRVCKTLKENGIEHIELWGVQPNPLVSKVREGIAICKDEKNGIQAVLAVGGGSVLDSSKAIACGAKMDRDIYDYYELKCPCPPVLLPVYTVLTLSATGSEFDFCGVVSNPEKHEKIGAFFPDSPVASAIDPSSQMSLPWRQVMCGAVDAMSHLMEAMFDKEDNSITTLYINFAIQKSIIKCMERMLVDPTDYNARENFCWSAALALNGLPHFGHAGDWNVHHIEHSVSVFDDNIAHGEGLAVVERGYYPIMYKKGVCKLQLEKWSEEVMGEKNFDEGIKKWNDLLKKWKAPVSLKDLKITEEKQVDEIVKLYEHHKQFHMVSNVNPLTGAEVKEVLMSVLN